MTHTPRTWAALAAASTLALSALLPVSGADKPAPTAKPAAAKKANDKKNTDKPPVTEESVLKSVKAPADKDVTVMGLPPQVMYTTCVAATAGGQVFVGIDEQGSLGKEKGRGRVVRVVDTDGDGKGDQFAVVAKMDHPRGLWFDSATNELYVLHPPSITKYAVGADGVATKSETLVTGISTEHLVRERGADHTTNGFRVGVDGWMYIAMGDFGVMKAVGTDGTELKYHGGGVARVRLDGSGLEMYSHHQRNICDVAVSPTLEVFTRDNTNDGGGWNVRLSYVIPNGEYGYPSLYKNFNDEIVQPLADYGGGSPVGAYWLDEPASGAKPGLYTVEWGANKIWYHPLERDGAGYRKPPQVEWIGVPRATDLDADAAGRIYVTSWANGQFAYSGDNVGYLLRVTPKNFKPAAVPKFAEASNNDLVRLLASPSQVTRQAAQREILFRSKHVANFEAPLFDIARNEKESLATRTIALFTLKQIAGPRSYPKIADLAKDESLRELAIRALGDTKNDKAAPVEPIVAGCADKDPRVRMISAWALGHLGRRDQAEALIPLVADADPLVSHTAINSLGDLKAHEALLKALDSSNPALAPGVLRALAMIHDVKVVDGLESKLKSIQEPAVRPLIFRALARLTSTEADWDGKWWGTRPDTSGPYYKGIEWAGTPKARQILQAAIAGEKPEVVKRLVVDLQKNKVDLPELTPLLVKMAGQDASFKPVLLEVLAARQTLPDDQVALVVQIATASDAEPATRATALRILQKNAKSPAAVDGLIAGLGQLMSLPKLDGELRDTFNDITRDTRLAPAIPALVKASEGPDAPKRQAAFAVLVNLANHKLLAKDKRVADVAKSVDAAWANDDRAASLLSAIAVTKIDAYNDKVSEIAGSAKNPQVAQAAAAAAKALNLKAGATASTVAVVPAGGLIEKIQYEQLLPAVSADKAPDVKAGAALYVKLGCAACHTVSADEQPKGPFLGGIAARYTKAELIESIVKPSAKIAQGFDTQWFKLEDDDVVDGFVVREAGDEVELRNIVGETILLKKKEIKERGKRETSIMPNGLMDKLTPHDLASLIAYLETTKAGK
ncbi:MAG TPA: HEAT repeat domain-containing protein [Tepidisphaeraceae bacterium]|nr:HEAT repeat domain-containing protein [Tepidisphaeraceae bacterium]